MASSRFLRVLSYWHKVKRRLVFQMLESVQNPHRHIQFLGVESHSGHVVATHIPQRYMLLRVHKLPIV